MTTIKPDSYDEIEIVGVAANYCVRYAYEGFKARGFNVTVRGDLTVGIKENPFS
jgi:nicotinamidase-related amidase